MEERLQKIIAAAGLMSRRAAEKCISDGLVTVNGVTAGLGDKADPECDEILVNGQKLHAQSELCYLVLYKPKGYVTTLSDEKGRKCVTELVQDVGMRVYPVGRLDLNSEGLLIMTNDGAFANALMHPSHMVNKTYRTHVNGENAANMAERLSAPMVIDGYEIQPAVVKHIKDYGNESVYDITIHEGRNRQVRKMCEQCGLTVKKLCRIQEGSLRLGKLRPGEWRYLSPVEVQSLLAE